MRLADGRALDAPVVVSGIDPKATFALCDPMALPSELRWRALHYRAKGTLAKVNLALSAMPVVPGADREQLTGPIRMAPDVDFIERAFDHAKYGRYSPSPWLEAMMPSLVDPSLAPAGGTRVVDLRAVRAGRRCATAPGIRRGSRSCTRCSPRSTATCPASRRLIVAAEVLTPADLERDWGLSGGHIHHGELTLDQLYTMRPLLGWSQYRTPIEGLWLCGAGTHPGLGLTGGSGANAARARSCAAPEARAERRPAAAPSRPSRIARHAEVVLMRRALLVPFAAACAAVSAPCGRSQRAGEPLRAR